MNDSDGSCDSLEEHVALCVPSQGEGVNRRRPFSDSPSISADSSGINELKEIAEEDVISEQEEQIGRTKASILNEPSVFQHELAQVLKVGKTDMYLEPLMDASREGYDRKVHQGSWRVCDFRSLPQWLQDNDYLQNGHRPPLPSFTECFKSVFKIHTETGNIWTHLLGCIAFIGAMVVFVRRPSEELPLSDKLALGTFFAGAILCLGLSFVFHAVSCHSEHVAKLFSKLDYCGIALLIMGSFVPWLYYGFYCKVHLMITYLTVVIVLGVGAMVVSLWDKFSESRYRRLRAGVFAVFGLSGVVPAVHYAITEGWINAVNTASIGWLSLMGFLYLVGALFYAFRIPECLFPGCFDIWFQSHQIFHVLVIAAAFVHLHGITEMLTFRMSCGACRLQNVIHRDTLTM